MKKLTNKNVVLKSLIAAFGLFVLSDFKVLAQDLRPKPLFKTPTPTSPQSSALIKSIEYPVDHARGLVNIAIPIYTIKVNDIEIPISLKYHSSGIKVHDMSGWVGLGWSLSAEPAITRSIQGRADERNFLNNELLGSNSKEYLEDLANNVNDELPDQFYYSLTNSSGSFLFSRKPSVSGWNIKTLPYQPFKIEPLGANTSQLTAFKITDDSGRQFYFGGSNVERTDLLDLTTWKGNEIISANRGDTVRFEYHPVVNEWVPKPQSHYITIDDQGSNTYDEMIAASSCSGGSTLRAPDEQLPKPMVAKYVNGSVQRFYWNISTQQLTHFETVDGPNVPSVEATEVLYTKKITFRGGRVEFEIGNRVSSSGSTIYDNIKRLNKILVYDDKNNILKEIRLSYQEETSYSNVPNNSNSIYQSRMLLQSVETFVNNVTVGERYEFTYDTERKLPNKFSYDLDLWGYYNGQKNNLSLVPVTMLEAKTYTNASVNLSLGDADRSSDPYYNYGQAAILTKIKYPTGGTTTFEYEPNKALDIQTNQLTTVGGFRIRKISEYDPASLTTRVRGFKYGTNESGGGYMRHWVTSAGLYDPFLTQQNKIALVNTLVVCGFPLTGYTYNAIQISSRYRTLMSNPVSSLFYNGEVVSYPEVSEYNGDAYQVNAGKTVHNFTFSGMGSLGGYETPFFINGTTLPYETKGEWVYGVANKINVFNSQSIANYNLVKHNGYEYLANFDPDKIWSRSVFKSTLTLDQFNGLAIYPYYYQTQINEYQTGYNQLLSDTVVVIENNTPAIHKIVNYTYGNSNLTTPTETSFINSAGRLIREKSMFPHQIVAVGNSQPYQEMINRNMINIPIRSEKYMDQTMIERKTTDFQAWNNGIIAPSKISVEKGGFIVEDRVQFEEYDKYGNLEQYRQAHAVSSSIKFGYKDQHPIAEIKNALLNEVYHQNLEEPELGLDFEANLIYDNSRSHTGVYSGRLSNSGSSEMVSMSSKRININLTAPKKYTYSGWVYSTGPTADIHLFMLKPGANEYYSYVDAASTGVTNKWVYIEKDFLVPGDVATLHLRIDNNSAGDVWFDDLSIRPSDATITTYTYKPLVGMTSMTDPKGMTTFYDYDSFGRLEFVRDQNGQIIKQMDYHYKN